MIFPFVEMRCLQYAVIIAVSTRHFSGVARFLAMDSFFQKELTQDKKEITHDFSWKDNR
jgi:hypothetical protein